MSRLDFIPFLEGISGSNYFKALPFDDTKEGKKKRDVFLQTEFTLFTCYINGLQEWDAEDYSILFEGWERLVLPNKEDIDDFRRLRLLINHFQNKSIWNKALEEYRAVEEKYCLYTISREGRLENRKVDPVCCSSRIKYYQSALQKKILRVETLIEFAKPEERYMYNRPTRDELYSLEIPERLVDDKQTEVKKRNKKKKITLSANLDWLKIGQKMDKVLQQNGYEPSYVERLKRLNLVSLNQQQMTLDFSNLIHILGRLSAGKSTWMLAVTYELVTKKKIKAGFIESSVANLLKRTEELRALGLRVATIIGKTERQKHEQERLSSPNLSIEDIANDDSFEDISSVCLAEALAGDETINNDYPCQRLYKTKTKSMTLLCPMATHCGIYKQQAMLDKADIWIATPASLLHSSIPKNLRKDNPSIYELFYEELDVVFVDEADAVQKTFDEQFINDLSLFGDGGYLIENFVRKVREAIHGFYEPDGEFITTYARKCDALADSARNLFQVILKSPKLKRKLKSSIAFKHFWYKKIVNKVTKLFSSEKDATKFIEILQTWNEYPYREEKVWRKLPNWLDKIELFLDKKIDLYSFSGVTKILNQYEVVQLESEWRFYLWLCRFEASFAYITNNYPYLLSYVPELNLKLPSTIQKYRLLPHLPTPILGYKYGYRLVEDSNQNGFVFKLIEYSTIGSTLLYRLPDLFMYCGESRGPGVVLLSGTTLAPIPSHYALKTPHTWLLTSNKKVSTLEQKFLPLVDNTGSFIRISGQPPELRKIALRQVATQLPSLIDAEMHSWEKEKGVMLVSNSYEDTLTLIDDQQLEKQKWNFKALARKVTHPNVQITRNQLERIAKETDVLLAPISAMNRGVNLLGTSNEAKYGTVFFLSRPYPPPKDISYILSYLHGRVFNITETIKRQGFVGKDALSELRRRCNAIFSTMYAKPDYWSSLSDTDRLHLAWYLFVPIWQMIGRLIRDGSPARVIYIDKSFTSDIDVPSLLETWYRLFFPHRKNELFQELYGPFIDSLEKMLQVEEGKKELEYHDQ
ncbi:hypothetical protein [Shimazuella kribbensis]|uniref:pPIWI_RE_Z domain-containing protein n=1 Tax=Shimazuella kribbensis TaxID=139808 RepID=UPI000424E78F|nr:hypothetical protein [Shimazuella kribbensis]